MRESVSRIDKDYLKKLQDSTNELADLQERMAQGVNKGEIVEFYFSSLCWYRIYETDFGWGRPVLVAWGGLAYKNFVVFMDTKSGMDSINRQRAASLCFNSKFIVSSTVLFLATIDQRNSQSEFC